MRGTYVKAAALAASLLLAVLSPGLAVAQDKAPETAQDRQIKQKAGEDRTAKEKSGQDLSTLDMEKSVRRALDANPQIAGAKAQYKAAAEGKKSALGAMGPSANVNAYYLASNGSFVFPNSGSNLVINQNAWYLDLNIHQPLFTGFRLLSTYQKAALAKDSAEAGISSAEIQLGLAVQQAFLGLLKARADVKSAEDSVARLTSQYKVAEAFYQVGLKPRLDVLQAQTDLARAEQTLLSAKNSVMTQLAQLNTYLYIPLEQAVDYVGELTYLPFTLTLDQCLDMAYRNRPDLYVALKSVEIAAKDAKIALSGIYPQIAADLDYITQSNRGDLGRDTYNFDQQTYQAKISLQWTAWDWGKTYFGYTQAQENAKKIFSDMIKLRLDIGLQVKTSFLNIQDAAKRITVARAGLEAAREGYRMAVARYQAQVGTSTDVLIAQSQMSQAEADLTQALTDYQKSLANLYSAIGTKNYSLAAM